MTRMVAAATQASISAACFIAGALLIAIGRGIANGMGGVGIDMDAPIFELPNGTSSSASSAQSFFERMMSDTAVHARWAHRRGAQAFDVFGLFFSVIGWVLAIPPISSLGAALGGQQRSCTNLVLYAFVAGGVLTLVEFTSEAGTAMVSDWMSQWPILATPTMNQAGELTAAQSFEITYMLVTSRSVWLYAMDSLFLAVALITASYLTYTAPHQQVSNATRTSGSSSRCCALPSSVLRSPASSTGGRASTLRSCACWRSTASCCQSGCSGSPRRSARSTLKEASTRTQSILPKASARRRVPVIPRRLRQRRDQLTREPGLARGQALIERRHGA